MRVVVPLYFTTWLFLLHIASTQYVDLSCLRIAHFKFPSGALITGPGVAQTFPFTWPSPVDGLYQAAMAINSFQVDQVDSFLSYEGALIGLSDAGGNVAFNPTQDRPSDIRQIKMDIFATSRSCSGKISITTPNFNPQVLNIGTRTLSSETFTVPDPGFHLTSQEEFFVEVFLFDFTMAVPLGSFQDIRIVGRTFDGLGSLTVTIYSTILRENAISKVRCSILVVKKSEFTQLYRQFRYYRQVILSCSNPTCSSSLVLPPTTQSIVALIAMTTKLASASTKQVGADWQSSVITISATNIFRASYTVYSYLLCTQGFYSSNTDVDGCLACDSPCLNCTGNATTCTACFDSFFLSGQECLRCDLECAVCYGSSNNCSSCQAAYFEHESSCVNCPTSWPTFSLQVYVNQITCGCENCFDSCSSHMLYCASCYANLTVCTNCLLGTRVQGGCSVIDGCTKVRQLDQGISAHSVVCLECEAAFDLVSGDCVCKNGTYQANGQCYSTQGCLTFIRQNDENVCKMCNISSGFVQVNGACVCSDGYSLIDGSCSATCGDGAVKSQECDDGNIDDGDGCSSVCIVEKNYNCQNGTVSTPSQCVFFGDLTFNISWMENIGTPNEGVIAVSVDPTVANIAKMDMTQLAEFRVNNITVPIKSWSYQDGLIKLFFGYEYTLEWEDGTLSITLDEKYVRALTPASQTQNFSFTVDSRDQQLVYYSLVEERRTLINVMTVYCAGLMLFFVVATCFHSMIGVQILHLNQLVFLLHFQTSHYTHSWAVLQTLTFCFGNFKYYDNEKSHIDLGSGAFQDMVFGTKNYHMTMLLLIISIAFLILLTLVAKLFVALCKTSHSQSQSLGHSTKLLKTDHMRAFPALLMRFMFSWALAFMMTTVLLEMSNTEENSSQEVKLVMILKFFLAMLMYIPCFALYCQSKEDRESFRQAVRGEARMHYIRAYFVFIILNTVSFGLLLVDSASQVQKYLILVTSTGLLVYECLVQPYIYRFHRFCAHLNLLLIVFFCLIMVFREIVAKQSSQENDIMAVRGVVGVLIVNLLLAVIRLVHVIYLKLCEKYEALESVYSEFLSDYIPRYHSQLNKDEVKTHEQDPDENFLTSHNKFMAYNQLQQEKVLRPQQAIFCQLGNRQRFPLAFMSLISQKSHQVKAWKGQTQLMKSKQISGQSG